MTFYPKFISLRCHFKNRFANVTGHHPISNRKENFQCILKTSNRVQFYQHFGFTHCAKIDEWNVKEPNTDTMQYCSNLW